MSVTYERKFNLGDYNSLHIGVTLWADVEDGENHLVAIKALQDDARDSVKNEYSRIVAKKSAPAGKIEPAVS